MVDGVTRDQRAEPASAAVERPALIVTFYGPTDNGGWLPSLVARLQTALALTQQSPSLWSSSGAERVLRSFHPPAAPDATVLQLALNGTDDVVRAWESLRTRLEAALDDEALRPLWGYTIVYQAHLTETEQVDAVLERLAPAARRFHLPSTRGIHPLATTMMADGWLSLIATPEQQAGTEAATVYLALSGPGAENPFVRNVLYHTGAALLMPDLIAHKGHWHMRQYRAGTRIARYHTQVRALRDATGEILRATGTDVSASDDGLDTLSRRYASLLETVTLLTSLRIALARQAHNYGRWLAREGGGAVLDYHQAELETSLQELDLLLAEGETVLSAARVAIDVIRARIGERQARWEQVTGVTLAVAGAAFAVPQLVNREVAELFLGWVRPRPEGAYGTLAVLVTQLAVMLVATGVLVLAVIWFGRRGHSRASRRSKERAGPMQ